MTNETIDKYLDQQCITNGNMYEEEGDVCINNKIVASLYFDYETQYVPNARMFANSRKSLRDWIMVAWVYHSRWDLSVGKLATENIEASLGKPWEAVRTELEGME